MEKITNRILDDYGGKDPELVTYSQVKGLNSKEKTFHTRMILGILNHRELWMLNT